MAGEDQLPLWLIAVGTSMILTLGFLMGKFFDINWRCNIMRRFTKNNYVVLNVLDKDNRFMKSIIVNTNDDTATIGTAMWVLTKGRIYEQTNMDSGASGAQNEFLFGKKKELPKKGFKISDKDIKFKAGTPQLFVDYDSLTPKDFYPTSEAIIKPNEIGSTLQAWVYNQIAKGFSSIANIKIILYMLCGLLAINILLSFISMNNSGACMKTAGEIQGALVPATAGGTIQGGSLVIDQTKQTPKTGGT